MDEAALLSRQYPLRILLAEDNEVNQHLMVRILQRMGYQPQVANNGREALELAKGSQFDLILMDIQMPEMDGTQATKLIRENVLKELQPWIVALTAETAPAERQKILQYQMDDFLSKPISVDDLEKVLKSCPVRGKKKSVDGQNIKNEFSKEPQDHSDEIVDMSVLAEFKTLMGDEGENAVKELVKLYLEDAAKLISTLGQAIKEEDVEVIRRSAHTLKGNSSQLGVKKIAILCKNIEDLNLERKAAEIQGAFLQLVENFQLVKRLLSQYS